MSGRLGRHLIGRFGVGTLWCVRERAAFFIQFNAVKIATRPLRGGGWVTLEDGWKVTPYGQDHCTSILDCTTSFGPAARMASRLRKTETGTGGCTVSLR
jgi:hypothetical protein